MDETGRLRSALRAGAVGPVRGFFTGVSLLGRGLGMWLTSPRLMLIGAIPALIVGAIYTALIITLILNLDGLAAWLTPFATEWVEPWRTVTRFAAAGGLLALAVLLFVYTFVAITLTVGDPFYERIWQRVEQRLGDAPAGDEPFWASVRRGVGNGVRLLATTVLIGLGLFALGFIPLVGQTVVPVLGALVGGWFLAVELTGFAFDARGMSLRERRRVLGIRRSTTLGFGVATYLLFLVPFAAIFVMPAAVVGATLLSRRALDATENASPLPQGW
jgi:CysZ protein